MYIRSVLHLFCPAYILSCICPVLPLTGPATCLVLLQSCLSSALFWKCPVLHFTYYAWILHCIYNVLCLSPLAFILSCICPVQHLTCPASDNSLIHPVLHLSCPCIGLVINPSCPCICPAPASVLPLHLSCPCIGLILPCNLKCRHKTNYRKTVSAC